MKNPFHICPLDKTCREHGAPARVHVNTRWGHIAFALRPDARFLRWCPNKPGQPWTEHWILWEPGK